MIQAVAKKMFSQIKCRRNYRSTAMACVEQSSGLIWDLIGRDMSNTEFQYRQGLPLGINRRAASSKALAFSFWEGDIKTFG